MHIGPARAKGPIESERIRIPLLLVLVAGAYFAAAKAGPLLGIAQDAPFAAAGATLLAGLLASPVQCWWGVVLAALAAHLAAQAGAAMSMPESLGWFAVAAARGLLAASSVRWALRASLRFDSVHHVMVFVVACVIVAPLLAALVVAPVVLPGREGVAQVLPAAAAALVLVPVFRGWQGDSLARLRKASWQRHLEGALLAVVLLGAGGAVFIDGVGAGAATALLCAAVPALLWAALRFGPFAGALALFGFSALAVPATARGIGPFALAAAGNGTLAGQLFLCGIGAPLLLFAAAVRECGAARRALREHDETLDLALDAARVGVWEMRFGDRMVAASSEVLDLFGLADTTAPVAVDTFLGRVHPDDRAAIRRAVERAATGVAGFRSEFRVVRPDGELRWLLAKGEACPEHGLLHLLGVTVDVTERKRAEALAREEGALRESEARFRQMADAMPQVVWTARPDGHVHYANRNWHALAGTDGGPDGDALWAAYICDDDRERYRRRWDQAVAAGTPFEAECRLRFPGQGGSRWYLARARPVRDALGRIERWYGTWTDIDAQKGAERVQRTWCDELERRIALRSAELSRANAVLGAEVARRREARAAGRLSETRFARVFRSSPVPMALSGGPGGAIWDVNDSWQALFGCKRADAIGRTPAELGLYEAGGASAGTGPDAIPTHGLRGCRRDGGRLEIVLSGARIDDSPDGCFLTIVRDETEQRRREGEARRQRDQLAYLSRVVVLGELCGAIAHELNQPLAAILANAQAAQRWLARLPAAPSVLGEIVTDIVEADRRAAAVIRRLRALFIHGETVRAPLDLNEVAREALVLAASSLAEQSVAVDTAFAPGLCPVSGDRVQLEQVLLNLVVNAGDAMRAVAPDARRLEVATCAADGAIRMTVADSGPGIPAALLEQVFDSFFTTKPHGLGFGLSVSRAIIVAHGGRIEAANRPGGGAVFKITLPVSNGGTA
jgi:PAS domain S-box-containing protein